MSIERCGSAALSGYRSCPTLEIYRKASIWTSLRWRFGGNIHERAAAGKGRRRLSEAHAGSPTIAHNYSHMDLQFRKQDDSAPNRGSLAGHLLALMSCGAQLIIASHRASLSPYPLAVNGIFPRPAQINTGVLALLHLHGIIVCSVRLR